MVFVISSYILLFISVLVEGFRRSSNDRLIFVHTLFRHGIRSPIHVMPSDGLNNEHSWYQGPGELQLDGMRQMYDLGKELRRIYGNQRRFLSKGYKAEEVFFRSTDVNRTLMSALCLAAGLYDERIDIPEWPVAWHPVAIHTWPKNLDPVLSEEIDVCSRLEELDNELAQSPFVKLLYLHNKGLFQYLSKFSGFDNIHPVNVSWVYDNLHAQLANRGHPWPWWVNGSMYDKVRHIYQSYVIQQFSNPERVRLRIGLLLKHIADRMNDQHEFIDVGSRLKLFAYSGHDTNLVSFLAAFNLLTRVPLPDFASCIILELWQNDRAERYIKMLYRPNATTHFEEISIPACGSPCSLGVFNALVQRYAPDKRDLDCGPSRTEEMLKFLIAGFSLSIFILLAIIIVSIWLLFQRRSRKYVAYYPVDAVMIHRLLDENSSESELSSFDHIDINR